jgi:hypothetical protein
MDEVERALGRIDAASAGRVRRVLVPLLVRDGDPVRLDQLTEQDLRVLLTDTVAALECPPVERHETAWALGDFFEQAQLPAFAAVCRDQRTHEGLSARPVGPRRQRADAWAAGLHRGRRGFWADVLAELEVEPVEPARLELALTPVHALLAAVRDGAALTNAGYLPPSVALALDTKFGWSDEYSRSRPRGESDLPALVFLHEHLRDQGLLAEDGRTVAPSTSARRLLGDPVRLWETVVDPRPRWRAGFEEDAVAVMAATLVRSGELTRDQLRDEMAYLLAGKWEGRGARTVDEGLRGVELAWYRLGITMGWWDREGGLWSTKVRLSGFGRAAAASAFWSVAGRHS